MTQASAITLTDQNASFVVNVDGTGVQSMLVDGVDHIWQQDFLHDVTQAPVEGKGGSKGTYTTQAVTRQEIGMIDDLSLWLQNPQITTDGSNKLTLDYTDTDVAISIGFELIGGALGSNAATIIESYTIQNTNPNGNIEVYLFAFTDIDLGGSFGNLGAQNDRGELLGDSPYTSYRQYDTKYQMIATTDSAPNHYMVGIGEDPFGNTLNEVSTQLYDTTNTVLNNTVATGPNDLQMAAQWIRTLAPGESFTYTHTLALCPIGGCPPPPGEVPVPAAIWLLGSGLLGLVGVARRRRQVA
jgi:hypothetical protein